MVWRYWVHAAPFLVLGYLSFLDSDVAFGGQGHETSTDSIEKPLMDAVGVVADEQSMLEHPAKALVGRLVAGNRTWLEIVEQLLRTYHVVRHVQMEMPLKQASSIAGYGRRWVGIVQDVAYEL
jgi:hypothetical protein